VISKLQTTYNHSSPEIHTACTTTLTPSGTYYDGSRYCDPYPSNRCFRCHGSSFTSAHCAREVYGRYSGEAWVGMLACTEPYYVYIYVLLYLMALNTASSQDILFEQLRRMHDLIFNTSMSIMQDHAHQARDSISSRSWIFMNQVQLSLEYALSVLCMT